MSSDGKPIFLWNLLLIILIGIVLSDIFISPAAAIKCYDCRNCPEVPDPENEQKFQYDCNREDPDSDTSGFCVKVVRHEGFVDRMCANKNTVQEALDYGHKCDEFVNGKLKVLNKVCFCESDFCNGAPVFGGRMMVILVVGLMLSEFLVGTWMLQF